MSGGFSVIKVLITSHGSTGDIYPFICLGDALIRSGHEVRFATVALFRGEIESAGISFVELPPDWGQSQFSEAMRDLSRAKNSLDLMGIIYSKSLPYLDEILDILEREMNRTDVFVTNYVFANLCELARKVEVPCAVITLTPHVVPSEIAPPGPFPGLPAPRLMRRAWNRLLWELTDRILCRQINRWVGATVERHGMNRAKSFLLDPSDLVLVAVSQKLFEPKTLWSDRFRFTGYLRWQSPENPELNSELDAFCQGERVPILTFGSVTFDQVEKITSGLSNHWPKSKKMIIQSGWAELTVQSPGPEIKQIGRVSHDQLFQYASMVIHHGGAGTTASVLHSGVPNVIIPHMGDQSFFASEIDRLGIGLKLKRKTWPEDLPEAVDTIEQSNKMRLRAKEVANDLAGENGPSIAVKQLENSFRNRQKR